MRALIAAVVFFILAGPQGVEAGWTQDGGTLNVVPTNSAYCPSLEFAGNTPYAAWHEDNGSAMQIYVKHLENGVWVADGGVLNADPGRSAFYASLAISSGTPYAAWYEYDSASNPQIRVKHFNGAGWEADGGSLNKNPLEYALDPSLAAAADNTLFLAWSEGTGAPTFCYQVMVQRLSGGTWSPLGNTLNVNANQGASHPSVAVHGNTPYVAWFESEGPLSRIYVKHYNGSDWELDGGSLNHNPAMLAGYPCIALSASGAPYVAWQESDGVAHQIYVKHYTAGSWQTVGGSLNVTTTANAKDPSLAVIGETPHVAWYEGGSPKIYAKHWNGSQWVQDGGALNTISGAYYPAIAEGQGKPYVAWQEPGGNFKITVKHWEPDTPTPTATPTATDTPTAMVTATATSTVSPTFTATPTATGTASPTPASTDTATATVSPTPASTDTASATASPSATPTNTASATASPSATPTNTASATATAGMTTATATRTEQATATETASPAATPAVSHTPTSTATAVPALTASPTLAPATLTSTPVSAATTTPTPASTPSRPGEGRFLVYPNPGREVVWFACPAEGRVEVQIDIYTPGGERVARIEESATGSPNSSCVIPWRVGNTAPGIYVCRVRVRPEGGGEWLSTVMKIALVK